jgi:hypothetical protein
MEAEIRCRACRPEDEGCRRCGGCCKSQAQLSGRSGPPFLQEEMEMKDQVTVSMPLAEWENEKNRIAADNYKRGKEEGHQSTWLFIQDAMCNPGAPLIFGKGFPRELQKVVLEIVEWAKARRELERGRG